MRTLGPMDAGLVPIKRLDHAKQRLLPAFDDEQRIRIGRALAEDALDLCGTVAALSWFVVTDDDDVASEAEGRGFTVVRDAGRGLNEAVGEGIGAAWAAGAGSVTIVPADVPLAFRGDIEDLLDTGATSDAVVVPSEDDGGTNALYLSPPDALEPAFGPASLRAHIDQAESRGLRCAILNLPRLALDLDTYEDAEQVLELSRFPSHTTRVLEELMRGRS